MINASIQSITGINEALNCCDNIKFILIKEFGEKLCQELSRSIVEKNALASTVASKQGIISIISNLKEFKVHVLPEEI